MFVFFEFEPQFIISSSNDATAASFFFSQFLTAGDIAQMNRAWYLEREGKVLVTEEGISVAHGGRGGSTRHMAQGYLNLNISCQQAKSSFICLDNNEDLEVKILLESLKMIDGVT